MLKPNEYRRTYVVAQDLPFTSLPLQAESSSRGSGTLHTGRVVSLSTDKTKPDIDVEVAAYAEGLGLVRVNSRWLNRMR